MLVLGIFLARSGPTFVKYLQNELAISEGSDKILLPDLNEEGNDGLALRLLMTSFISLQVAL